MARSTATTIVEKALFKGVVWTVPRRTLLRRGPEGTRKIALTFDDGPHPEGTPRVLEILARYQVKATFFLVGNRAAEHPHLARRIAEEGHEIGNHTQTHRILTEIGREEWIEEIEAGERTLERMIGRTVSLFRPPKGEISLSILRHMAARKKITVLWSVDPKDFLADQEERLWDNLKQKPLRGGEIVLLHDRTPATAAVLRQWIESIFHQGLQFTTVGGILR